MTTLAKDLAAVLDDECRALHAEYSCTLPLAFTADDIREPAVVADRLSSVLKFAEPARATAADIAAKLNDLTTASLRKYLGDSRVPEDLRLLFDQSLEGEDRRRTDRLLLEAILGDAVRPLATTRLSAVYAAIHRLPPRSALCLSGGGIRSATFGLGLIQGLARNGLLTKLDYLSTVSGGGYIGSWLTAWINRHRNGIAGVVRELSERNTAATSSDPAVLFDEPAPVGHLRTYSNYLNPRLGLLSADTWTLGAIVGRNLIIHWLLLMPIAAFIVAIPRLLPALISLFETRPYSVKLWLAPSLFAFGFLMLAAAIAYISYERPSVCASRGTTSKFIGRCLVPLALSAMSYAVLWPGINEKVRQAGWTLAKSYPPIALAIPQWMRAVPSMIWGGTPHSLVLRPPAVPLPLLLAVLGAAVNVIGWAAWVAAPRATMRGSRRWELLFAILAGALGGILVWVAATRVLASPGTDTSKFGFYIVGAVPLFLLSFLLGETVFAGCVSRWTEDDDREWWARAAGWVSALILFWAVAAAVVVFGPTWVRRFPEWFVSAGGISGIVSAAIAQSSKTGAVVKKVVKTKGGLNLLFAIFASVFVVALGALLSFATNELIRRFDPFSGIHQPELHESGTQLLIFFGAPLSLVVAILACLAALAIATSWLFNVNKFSLHNMYRNRLIRAYLGASNANRAPNPFTGFDSEDNVELSELTDTVFLMPENVSDAGRLRSKLRSDPGAEYEFLRSQLSVGTLERVRNESVSDDDAIETVLHDLNRVIEQPDLAARAKTFGLNPAATADRTSRFVRWTDALPYAMVVRQNREILYGLETEIVAARPAGKNGAQVRGRVTRPFHLINGTLNLVGGQKLAWQQRKAEPFSFSPLHCGSFRVGYRDSNQYAFGAQRGGRPPAISLGTAMAISGAAASPNMGYHSWPAATLLMTIFNVRLGWWLGNPARDRFADGQPRFSMMPLIDEALGRTNDTNRYIYLSDGGHFENLGLYEMVLRRCKLIIVSDAGNDPDRKFEDLGNAIYKIRIDLGIPIDFPHDQGAVFAAAHDGLASTYCAVGEIRYDCVDAGAESGRLIYIKPGLVGTEPRDVLHYRSQNPAFPHESTADQWFSESQFESYRALGSHIVEELCERTPPADLKTFANQCATQAADASTKPERPARRSADLPAYAGMGPFRLPIRGSRRNPRPPASP